MRRRKWAIALYVLVILAVVGLIVYEALMRKEFRGDNLVRALLIAVGALTGIAAVMGGARRRTVRSKKATYQKAYGDLIGTAFSERPREERQLYRILDDYNRGRYAAGRKRLQALQQQCTRSAERFTVAVFSGLFEENLGKLEAAREQYQLALRISENPVVANNIASCYKKLGQVDRAMEFYERAIHIDPNYAIGYSNIAHAYIGQGEYALALPYAQKAKSLDAGLLPALSGMAICHAMLGQREAYEKAYREAVSAGYDGAKLKRFICSLDPALD